MLTPQQYRDYYRRLPDNIREAYSSEDTVNKIKAISDKHRLHIDQLGELSDEIGLVMLGITKPTDFVKNIAERLKVDQVTAEAVGVDINNEIFLPIRESLEKISSEPPATGTTTPGTLPTEAKTSNIFEEKMGKMFDLNDGTTSNKPVEEETEKPEIDPYREPIN
jgi:predicted RNA-binding protein with RPS1 domain